MLSQPENISWLAGNCRLIDLQTVKWLTTPWQQRNYRAEWEWQTLLDPPLPGETRGHLSSCNRMIITINLAQIYVDAHLLKEPLKQMTRISMILAVTPSTPRLVRRNAETFWSSVQINRGLSGEIRIWPAMSSVCLLDYYYHYLLSVKFPSTPPPSPGMAATAPPFTIAILSGCLCNTLQHYISLGYHFYHYLILMMVRAMSYHRTHALLSDQ